MIYTIRQKIQEVFAHYDRHVPADVINRLFVAIPYDETTLTQEILGYLLEHNYEALKTPEGQSLRERLISTDWRQKEEKKWLSDTERSVVFRPKEASAMATDVSAHSIKTPFDQSNKVLITLVILFVTILLWLWKGKLTEIGNGAHRTELSGIEQVQDDFPVQPKETVSQPKANKIPKKVALLPVTENPVIKNNPDLILTTQEVPSPGLTELGVSAKSEPAKPYDTADNRVGDFGLRAAQKGSKWGYINQKDAWRIEPIYDDVTPFQNGKAIVILDGQQITIDGNGTRIREEN